MFRIYFFDIRQLYFVRHVGAATVILTTSNQFVRSHLSARALPSARRSRHFYFLLFIFPEGLEYYVDSYRSKQPLTGTEKSTRDRKSFHIVFRSFLFHANRATHFLGPTKYERQRKKWRKKTESVATKLLTTSDQFAQCRLSVCVLPTSQSLILQPLEM